MAAKRNRPPRLTKKQRSEASKKGWAQRKAHEAARREAEEFARRSEASKKGWAKKRGKPFKKKRTPKNWTPNERVRELEGEVAKLRAELEKKHDADEVTNLRRELEEARTAVELIEGRFERFITLDNLPARLINETAHEHAARLVRVIRAQGVYDGEAAYRDVAAHTGVSPREAYTLFLYVGVGDMVA